MHALAASCEELRARTGDPPLDLTRIPGAVAKNATTGPLVGIELQCSTLTN
jgi:hypothetical protein